MERISKYRANLKYVFFNILKYIFFYIFFTFILVKNSQNFGIYISSLLFMIVILPAIYLYLTGKEINLCEDGIAIKSLKQEIFVHFTEIKKISGGGNYNFWKGYHLNSVDELIKLEFKQKTNFGNFVLFMPIGRNSKSFKRLLRQIDNEKG